MPKAEQKKGLCFVIAPIGEETSDTRRRSDQVLEHIITPAANECGYEVMRADRISEPGVITSQVIQHLIDDPLVVADLTGRNANVFYELAVRHVVRKPIVQLIQAGEDIPFDVAQIRTIQVDHRDLDSAAKCRAGLVRQIEAVEKDPLAVDTPISTAIDLKTLRDSGEPLQEKIAQVIEALQELRAGVRRDMAVFMERLLGDLPDSARLRVPAELADELMSEVDRIGGLLGRLQVEEELDGEAVEHVRALLKDHAARLAKILESLLGSTLVARSGPRRRIFR